MNLKRASFNLSLWASTLLLVQCSQEIHLKQLAPVAVESFRQLEIAPGANEYKPTIKLGLMIDNSASMGDEQVVLTEGVRKMADSLRNINVDFSIYTSSALDSSIRAGALKSSGSFDLEYIMLGRNGADGLPLKTTTAPGPFDTNPFAVHNVAHLTPSQSNGSTLQIRADMNDDEFAAAKKNLVDAVASVGTDGSDDEAILCSLGRVLAEDEKNVAFKKGDKAAFIIVSDDNDYSIVSDCNRETKQKWHMRTNPDTSVTTPTQSQPSDPQQWYSYTASYKGADTVSSDTYNLRVDWYNPNTDYFQTRYNTYLPTYTLAANYSTDIVTITYSYTYLPTQCSRDGQTYPCARPADQKSVAAVTLSNLPQSQFTGIAYNQAAALCSTNASVMNYISGLSSLQGTSRVFTCSFSSISTTGLVSENFAPSTYGMSPLSAPVSGQTCSDAQLARTKTLVSSMTNKRFIDNSCAWSYSEPTITSYTNVLLSKGPSYGFVTSADPKVATAFAPCPTSPADASTGSEITAAIATGRVFRAGSCNYRYIGYSTSGTNTPTSTPQSGMTAGVSGTCGADMSAALNQLALTKVPTGKTYKSCSYTYTHVNGATGPISQCSFTDTVANVGTDQCASTGLDAKMIATCVAGKTYVPGSCSRVAWYNKVTTTPGSSLQDKDGALETVNIPQALRPGVTIPSGNPELDATAFIDSIVAQSDELFGKHGYFSSAIIPPTDPALKAHCQGQQPGDGKQYRSLLAKMGTDRSYEHSICDSDYGQALENVQKFIVRTVINSYNIPLQPKEVVEEVHVTHAGQSRVLTADTDYTAVGGSITFTDGVIAEGDSVSFKIAFKDLVRANGGGSVLNNDGTPKRAPAAGTTTPGSGAGSTTPTPSAPAPRGAAAQSD